MNNFDLIREGTRRALEHGRVLGALPITTPQRDALSAYKTFISNSGSDRLRGYFDMATGTGKTGVFSTILRHSHLTAMDGRRRDFRSVIVVPTTLLLQQTYDDVLATGPELKGRIGIFGAGNKQLDKPVTIMTYPSWAMLAEQGALRDASIGLHISDEAHYGLSVRRQKLINDLLPDAVHLAFTATSEFDPEKTLQQTHRNMIYKIGLRQAVEKGFLADYAHVQFAMLRLNCDPELSNAKLTGIKRAEWTRLVTHAYTTGRDDISGQALHAKKATIFAADTAHADHTAERLNANPVLKKLARERGMLDVAVSIHSVGMSSGDQKLLLEAFKAGLYMAAVGDQKFKEGYDDPEVKFSASYPENSVVSVVQKIGRAVRKWNDPVTGAPQGAVIFEAVPYVGGKTEQEEERRKQAALRDCTTAYEILKGNLVLSPHRNAEPPALPVAPGNRDIVLSPLSTAQLYMTSEDSLTITRAIADSRRSVERIEITDQMHEKLTADLKERNVRGLAFMSAIGVFEMQTGVVETGLTGSMISEILSRKQLTATVPQWDRMMEVLPTMPLVAAVARTAISDEMRDGFSLALDQRNLNITGFLRVIEAYETRHGLAGTGLSLTTINNIFGQTTKTMPTSQWDRIMQVMPTLPILSPEGRISISDKMYDGLSSLMKRKDVGPNRLLAKIQDYENAHGLVSTDISLDLISRVTTGRTRSIAKSQWDRIYQVLPILPDNKPQERVAISDEMYGDILTALKDKNTGYKKLVGQIEAYELVHGLKPTGLTGVVIQNMLKRTTRTMPTPQWDRMTTVLVSLPSVTLEERITVTDAMHANLCASMENKNIGRKHLVKQVQAYEVVRGLKPTGLADFTIAGILNKNTKTMPVAQWNRLTEVLADKSTGIMEITNEMHHSLCARLKRGNLGAVTFVKLIEAYEKQHHLPSTGLSGSLINNIIARRSESIYTGRWQRIQQVLETFSEKPKSNLAQLNCRPVNTTTLENGIGC